jgi:hypothetical protein
VVPALDRRHLDAATREDGGEQDEEHANGDSREAGDFTAIRHWWVPVKFHDPKDSHTIDCHTIVSPDDGTFDRLRLYAEVLARPRRPSG